MFLSPSFTSYVVSLEQNKEQSIHKSEFDALSVLVLPLRMMGNVVLLKQNVVLLYSQVALKC